MNRNRDFEGRRILITGGASGIGLATARMIADRGGRAAVLDRDRAALDRLDISGVTGHLADVAETPDVEAAVAAAAAEMGGIDGVVCAAGIDHQEPLARITDAAWARSIGVNLTSPMLVMRAALPHLAGAGAMEGAGAASAVFISSAAGLVPLKGRASYCAAKAGVVMLAKSLAMELADQGVRPRRHRHAALPHLVGADARPPGDAGGHPPPLCAGTDRHARRNRRGGALAARPRGRLCHRRGARRRWRAQFPLTRSAGNQREAGHGTVFGQSGDRHRCRERHRGRNGPALPG
jgi:NADP-dependent 3-hydroxy acid dehydrogenase YdfG